MKLGQILQFDNLYQSIINETMPVKTAYKLMKIYKAIEASSEFYKTKFQGIINEYAEKDADGNIISDESGIKILDNKLSECNTKLTELNEIDVESPDVKFTLDEFDKFNLTLPQMNLLMEFIEE